jgi:GNAT superfamily N-acetyltransferase
MTSVTNRRPEDRNRDTQHASFAEEIRIDHGPNETLGRFFLAVDTLIRARGLLASFAPARQFVETNEAHFDTWGKLIPLLDGRHARFSEKDVICVVCRNRQGEIVAIQGERLFRAGARTLADLVESGEFFDSDLADPKAEVGRCEITAAGAKIISGNISYCGGLWVHPDYRSLRLASILPRLTRAWAVAHWNADYSIGFLKPSVATTDLGRRYGYPRFEAAFRFYSRGELDYDGVILWMTQRELIADIERFLADNASGTDAGVRLDGAGAQQQRSRA